MGSVICTLFENHYHYGFAALINSFYKQGYKGDIYAGYRGSLPKWADGRESSNINWPGSSTLKLNGGLYIHFLPLDTEYHLTNYKAIFMLKLWNDVIKNADGIFYFDPDIIIKCRWQFFENWIEKGVALVHEIVSNDMPKTHPIRKEWEKVIQSYGSVVSHSINSYINGGFCGISRKDISFIEKWGDLINIAINDYKADPRKFSSFDRTYPFWSIDQDAINMAAMCTETNISEMGPDAMDFVYGGWVMSHATGNPKPWKKNYTLSALRGKGPSQTDKLFWVTMYNSKPINLYSNMHVKMKLVYISMAKFMSRIYHRR